MALTEISRQLRSLGYSDAGIRGITENLAAESSLDPGAINAKEGSVGLAQWRLGRRTSLEAFAASRGTDWKDLGTQVAFLHDELGRDYPTLQRQLQKTSNPYEAAVAFARQFERPAAASLAARERAFAKSLGGQTMLAAAGEGDLSPSIQARSAERAQARIPATLVDQHNDQADEKGGGFESLLEHYGGEAARSAIEFLSPRSVAAGVENALAELYDSADSFSRWLAGPSFDWTRTPGMSARLHEFATRPLEDRRPFNLGENIPEPQTAGGQLTAGIAQFATGLALTKKFLPFGGSAAAVGRGALSGALAFDPRETGLVDAVDQAFPELGIPNFLLTNPDDSEAVARLKQGLKTTLPAVAVDGLVSGLRYIRAARAARRLAASDQRTAEALAARSIEDGADASAQRDLMILGDPNAPLVKRVEVAQEKPEALVRKRLELDADAFGESRVQADIWSFSKASRLPVQEQARLAAEEGGPITKMQVNFSKIDGPEDVRAAMQAFVSEMPKDRAEIRNAVRRNSEVTEKALGVDPFQVLLDNRAAAGRSVPGEAETYALRELWTQAADTTIAASVAAATDATPGKIFAASKATAAFKLISDEVLGIRTAQARTLQQWSIKAGGSTLRANQLQGVLDSVGGRQFNLDIAKQVAVLAQVNPAQVAAYAQKAQTTTPGHALSALFVNNLLWAPKTHITNTTSNLVIAAQQLLERKAGSWISQGAFGSGEIKPGEITEALFGQIEGFKDALRITRSLDTTGTLWASLATGRGGRYAPGIKYETHPQAIAEQLERLRVPQGVAKVMDAVLTAPGRAMMAEDELFKSVAYRQELAALAFRRASAEAERSPMAADVLRARVNELKTHPPQDLIDAAVEQARTQTLTAPAGVLAEQLAKAAQKRWWLRWITPFISTPSNIYNYSMERTPLAPLMTRWREDYSAGGAKRDLALARWATGSMLTFLGMDLYQQGLLSGPIPKEPGRRQRMQAENVLPNAVKVGENWVDLSRMDPWALPLLYGATIGYMLDRSDPGDDQAADAVERAIWGVVLGTSSQVLSRSYMTGPADLMRALDDPGRYGEKWAQGIATAAIPMSSGLSWARRLDDPVMRSVDGLVEAAMNKLPGVSSDLPVSLDFWARPKDYRSGLGWGYDEFMPWRVETGRAEPIDKEMDRLGYYPQMPDRSIKVPAPDGRSMVDISLRGRSEIYNRYLTLARQGVRDPTTGRNALETLNDMVIGNGPLAQSYSRLDQDLKIKVIRDIFTEFDRRARLMLYEENPEVRALADRQAAAVGQMRGAP